MRKRYALAQLRPRQMSGKACTEVLILKVCRQHLDRLLKLDEKGDGGQVVVSDIDAEGALVSDVVRNTSVSMLTDGSLMHLTKEDFVDLI